MASRTADDYRREGLRSVPGWFFQADAVLFQLVSEIQGASGVHGDVLEVGTYVGKSAIMLGFLLDDGERLTVCDLFDGEATNDYSARENAHTYTGLVRAQFEEQYLRFHAQLPNVIAAPSTTLRQHCTPGAYRFMHIDGSHMYPDVAADLALAKDLAVGPGAVVAIDDVNSTHTPGVWDAAWECVHKHGLKPFAITNKMYATWGDPTPFVDALRSQIADHPDVTAEEHPSSFGSVLLTRAVAPPTSRTKQFVRDWLPPALLKKLR